MNKLSMSILLDEINRKFIYPAVQHRKKVLFNYVKGLNEKNSSHEAFYIYEASGNCTFVATPGYTHATSLIEKIYAFELLDYNQLEISKHIKIMDDLEISLSDVKKYLSYLNNKSNNITDVAYALPPHINQLVPLATPTTYLDTDLRNPQMYALLNELQIKLLLLS